MTIQKNQWYNLIEHLFGVLLIMRGEYQMSNNLIELFKLILENDNPEQAVLTVADIIFDCQAQHGQRQEETFAYRQVNSRMLPPY